MLTHFYFIYIQFIQLEKDSTRIISKYCMFVWLPMNLQHAEERLLDSPTVSYVPLLYNSLQCYLYKYMNEPKHMRCDYPRPKGDFHRQFMCNNNKMDNLVGSGSVRQRSLILPRTIKGKGLQEMKWNTETEKYQA